MPGPRRGTGPIARGKPRPRSATSGPSWPRPFGRRGSPAPMRRGDGRDSKRVAEARTCSIAPAAPMTAPATRLHRPRPGGKVFAATTSTGSSPAPSEPRSARRHRLVNAASALCATPHPSSCPKYPRRRRTPPRGDPIGKPPGARREARGPTGGGAARRRRRAGAPRPTEPPPRFGRHPRAAARSPGRAPGPAADPPCAWRPAPGEPSPRSRCRRRRTRSPPPPSPARRSRARRSRPRSRQRWRGSCPRPHRRGWSRP